MSDTGVPRRPALIGRRAGGWRREGVVPFGPALLLLVAAQGLAVAVSVTGRGGHRWAAWALGALAVVVLLASVLALASRHEGRRLAVIPVALAIIGQVGLCVALAVGAGPALRDLYLGVIGDVEQVAVQGPVDDDAVSERADAPRGAPRPVRLRVSTIAGGPVRGGSTVLDVHVPGEVYATYMSRVRAGDPPSSWPVITLRVDPLGVVSPLPVGRDGRVARTSPVLPAGQFLAAVFVAWLVLGALVALPERRARAQRGY